MIHFQPLKVVGRGSETQLQLGENLIWKRDNYTYIFVYFLL